MYIRQMCKIIFLCTWAKDYLQQELNQRPHSEYPATITTVLAALMQYVTQLYDIYTVLPGGWWRTSGAGPASPPAPAMTSPGRASAWISLKPRLAAEQARGLARAGRRRCGGALWPDGERASDLKVPRWLVAVQLTSCHDRLTGPAPVSRIGGPGPVVRACSPPVRVMLARRSLRPAWGVKLTWTYGGRVHAQAGPVSQ